MNLYRVAHVYRANPDAAPQEKVLMVGAESEEAAAMHVNAKPGHEVLGVTLEKRAVEVADPRLSFVAEHVPVPAPAPPKPFPVIAGQPTLKRKPTLADMDAEENG